MKSLKVLLITLAIVFQILGFVSFFINIFLAILLFALHGICFILVIIVLIKERKKEKREEDDDDYRNY